MFTTENMTSLLMSRVQAQIWKSSHDECKQQTWEAVQHCSWNMLKMVNGCRYYRALESVNIASALSSPLTIYPCQIRVHQRWQSQTPTSYSSEEGEVAGHSRQFTPRRLPVNCETRCISGDRTHNLSIVSQLCYRDHHVSSRLYRVQCHWLSVNETNLLIIRSYNLILVMLYNCNYIFSSPTSNWMALYSLIVLMCR